MSIAVKNISFPNERKDQVRLHFGQCILNVPSSKLCKYLISGPQLDLNSLSFHGGRDEVKIMQGEEFIFQAFLKDRIYCLYFKIPNSGPKSVFF